MSPNLLEYAVALERILALPFDPGTGTIPLLQSTARILAGPVAAPWPLPRFDNSAMDGFAVRASDLESASGASPRALRIAGESAAGRPFEGIVPSPTAIRISTGAPVPDGVDAVVPVEQVRVERVTAYFAAPAKAGQFIRHRGADVREGQELFGAGTLITPEVLSFLAFYNLPSVTVFRRPRVGILTSGDEIVLHGAPLAAGQIVGSSVYYLEKALERCHCEARLFGVAPDDEALYRQRFAEALEWSEILVTTAGVSVGEHDVVGRVIESLGGEVLFWRVAVRPGKPMIVARFGGKIHFGFPGNPVSTCCNTEIFLKPFLRRAFRMEPAVRPRERMRLAAPCPRDRQRLFFVHGISAIENGDRVVRPLLNQNSGNILNPALANCLIVVEPGPDGINEGIGVEVIALRTGL